MPKPLSKSRKTKLEPYTIDELLNNPSMRGLVSFLDVHPEKRGVEPGPASGEPDSAAVLPCPAPAEKAAPLEGSAGERTSAEVLALDDRSPDTTPGDDGGDINTSRDVISPEVHSPAVLAPDVIPDEIRRPSSIQPAHLSPEKTLGATISRRRVIYVGDRAQNAHTASENVFYAWVWRHARPQDDDTRVLALKVPVIAYELNMAERNTRFLIERMIRKLAIEPLPGWIQGQQTGKTYAVYSFRRILERRRKDGLLYALKGKGVELITEVQAREFQTHQARFIPEDYGDEQPGTSPDGLSPDGSQGTLRTSPDANGITSPDVFTVASLYTSKATTEEEDEPTRELATLLARWITVDDDAVRQILAACRRGSPECTPEEIDMLARTKLPLIKSGKVDNPAGLLIRTVPRFFENHGSIALQQLREATRKRREEEERRTRELREQQQKILDDPNATDEDREWARQMLELEEIATPASKRTRHMNG